MKKKNTYKLKARIDTYTGNVSDLAGCIKR